MTDTQTGLEAAAPAAAVAAAYRDAQHWFTAQATRNPSYTAALADRGLTASQARAAGIGWAPPEPAALTDHLIRRGHRLSVLRAAGVSVRRGPRHGDVLRGRITFAYRDPTGAVVGFSARTTTGAAAKWLNTRTNAVFDKSEVLYGIHAIADRTQGLAIVEGAWDAATVTATTNSRIVAVTACGTGFTPAHAHTVAQLGLPVIVATDADAAGRAAAVRIHQELTAAGLGWVAYLALPQGHDPSSWHTSGQDLPAALAGAAPGSLTRHVIDHHRDQLHPNNGLPAQLARLRHLAPALAGLPSNELAAAIAYLVDLTGLLPLTIHDTLTTVTPDPARTVRPTTTPPPCPPVSTLPASGIAGRISPKEQP